MNSEAITDAVHFSTILMGLLGGLSLFLYGMEQMTDALKKTAGSGMKSLLASLTTNRFKSAFTGAFVTAVIQSSSVTTVLVVGFITSGLLTLQQSIGIIMGANVGTTVTAQVIAFKVTQYGLILITIGFALQFFSQRQTIRSYGAMVMGLGLIFFGMDLMSGATKPLRSYAPFIEMLQHMDHPFKGILASAVFTALVQSSSATTGIIIVLASQGFISLEIGISLILGANIGTCVTAFLAAMKKPPEALQAALVHILFNILGAILCLFFIPQLADFVRLFSPTHPGLDGLARLSAETPRQIANAHTVFNIASTFLFIWFVNPIAWIVIHLAPIKQTDQPVLMQPIFLDDALAGTPDIALDRIRMELGRLGEKTLFMVEKSLPIVLEGKESELAQIEKWDDDIDHLQEAIIEYVGKLSQQNLTVKQHQGVYCYTSITNYFENIGDAIEINLVQMAKDRLKNRIQIDDQTFALVNPLITRVFHCLDKTVQSIKQPDIELSLDIIQSKSHIREAVSRAKEDLIVYLSKKDRSDPQTYRIMTEIVESLRRIYYFSKRISINMIKYLDENRAKEMQID